MDFVWRLATLCIREMKEADATEDQRSRRHKGRQEGRMVARKDEDRVPQLGFEERVKKEARPAKQIVVVEVKKRKKGQENGRPPNCRVTDGLMFRVARG